MSTTFCTRSGRRTKLGDLDSRCGHVFCATDLIAGCPFFFVAGKHGYVYDAVRWHPSLYPARRSGWADASEVKLQAVVRASAAFPGALPPKLFRFVNSSGKDTHVFLADGGVWNNLATQWWGADAEIALPDDLESEDEGLWFMSLKSDFRLFVVNAAAPVTPVKHHLFRIPLLAEIVALGRSMTMLYMNTVEPRVRGMEATSERHYLRGGQKNQCVVSIDNEPGDFARSIQTMLELTTAGHWQIPKLGTVENPRKVEMSPERQEILDRAKAWIEYQDNLRDEGTYSNLYVDVPAAVPTTLGRIDKETAARVLMHGYLLAMEAMHVVFAAPLVDFPGHPHFRRLIKAD